MEDVTKLVLFWTRSYWF